MDGSTAETGGDNHPVDHLHDRAYVAGVLGVSESTVTELVSTGQLQAYRLGHRLLRISDGQLADYLASREVRA